MDTQRLQRKVMAVATEEPFALRFVGRISMGSHQPQGPHENISDVEEPDEEHNETVRH